MVAAMALGAGEVAMARAAAHSRERTLLGKPLCEHQGFVGKLLLPHAIRLAAARAYIDRIAARLDGGEAGLQTEGAVAKLFATEAASSAADAAMQALGGYGYMQEYVVEKIRRDVRVTTIYEGTSEVMQSLIYIFRLRQVVRGGSFFEDMARECEGPAAALLRRCAGALDRLVLALHRQKIGRRQDVRLRLADRMVEVEHALALSRVADHADSGLQAAARLLAADTAAALAVTSARVVATSELSVDALLSPGSTEDTDRAMEWALEKAGDKLRYI
jgi:hypothetical protein